MPDKVRIIRDFVLFRLPRMWITLWETTVFFGITQTVFRLNQGLQNRKTLWIKLCMAHTRRCGSAAPNRRGRAPPYDKMRHPFFRLPYPTKGSLKTKNRLFQAA